MKLLTACCAFSIAMVVFVWCGVVEESEVVAR